MLKHEIIQLNNDITKTILMGPHSIMTLTSYHIMTTPAATFLTLAFLLLIILIHNVFLLFLEEVPRFSCKY